MLRTSGETVSSAVQRILNVQGSLDDLKEDLSTDYRRWKAVEKDLTAKKQLIEREIKAQEAMLLEQRSLQEKAARLRGDLALAKHAGAVQNQTQAQKREEWQKKQEALQEQIQALLDETNATERASWATIQETRNRTNVLRQNGSSAGQQALKANATATEFEEARAKHSIASSREQAVQLKALADVSRDKSRVSIALQAQSQLQWEHDRLAEQAHKVVMHREEIAKSRVDCDAKVRKLHDKLEETAQAIKDDAANIRRCQQMQAENSVKQERANECRLSSASAMHEARHGLPGSIGI